MPTSKASPAKRKAQAIPPKAKKRKTKTSSSSSRSIWNAADDWDQLVADSQLSTASISTRRPRDHGLPTLAHCASVTAVREFKRLWAEERPDPSVRKGWAWKDGWEEVPDHLKIRLREMIFQTWGTYLTEEILTDVFAFPPVLYLPGRDLSKVATSSKTRTFRPKAELLEYTTLIYTHASNVTDMGLAEIIHYMPNLRTINLKGCTLAGEKVIDTILKRCSDLRRINLKGTKVKEEGVKRLLEKFAEQLECFKVDNVVISNAESTFSSGPYPRLGNICIPCSLSDKHRADRQQDRSINTSPGSTTTCKAVGSSAFSSTFPSVTKVYLPRSDIPPSIVTLPSNTLVKLVLASDRAIPIQLVLKVIDNHQASLRKIQLGYLSTASNNQQVICDGFVLLASSLYHCNLTSLKLQCGSSKDVKAVREMTRFGDMLMQGMSKPWRQTLEFPGVLEAPHFWERNVQPVRDDSDGHQSDSSQSDEDSPCPVLEVLEIPGVKIDDPPDFANALTKFRRLKRLDFSGTSIQEDDLMKILDCCPLLSSIDLTSCRGVKVQNRRNIFKVWEEKRRASEPRHDPTE